LWDLSWIPILSGILGPLKKDDKEEEGDKITEESKTGCTLSPYTC
jgi:hypothetical protein